VIGGIELKQAGGGDPAKSGFFLNVHLKDQFIEEQVNALIRPENLSLHKDEEFKQ
jgi:hypothetical protein